jgi:hypothetical protein
MKKRKRPIKRFSSWLVFETANKIRQFKYIYLNTTVLDYDKNDKISMTTNKEETGDEHNGLQHCNYRSWWVPVQTPF